MSFLRKLLDYKSVCIQCHNNPDADALASAFAVYRYLTVHGIQSDIIYGGAGVIKKMCMKMMVKECGIPVQHVIQPDDRYDLHLYVDCQKGAGNVAPFPSRHAMIIDHHVRLVEENDDYLIDSACQSCSTLIWEMLKEEDYPLEEDPLLCVALLYGLYTDTSCFADLFAQRDTAMRTALFSDQPLFERLTKSNLSVAELLIASDAMINHYFDVDRRYAIVQALACDQTILGMIGDFMIQVDVVTLSFAYTDIGVGYQISLRTCSEKLEADKIAAFVCRDIGSGGGHRKKAGGFIDKKKLEQKYPGKEMFDVVDLLLSQYIDRN